jgi:hypothetical protein
MITTGVRDVQKSAKCVASHSVLVIHVVLPWTRSDAIARDQDLVGAPSRDRVGRLIGDPRKQGSQAEVIAVVTVLSRVGLWGADHGAGRAWDVWCGHDGLEANATRWAAVSINDFELSPHPCDRPGRGPGTEDHRTSGPVRAAGPPGLSNPETAAWLSARRSWESRLGRQPTRAAAIGLVGTGCEHWRRARAIAPRPRGSR